MADLHVNPEDLVVSGVSVTGHGEAVAIAHAVSDTRIESAQAGWQGLSSAALAAKSASWMQTSSSLLTRMADHAQGLHEGAQTYLEGEQQSSAQLRALAPDGGA